jgi:LysM repeat protein
MMKTHRLIALLAACLFIISLAACNRSIQANKKPTTAPAEGGAAALPTAGATDVLGQIYLFATQTAMATQGLSANVPPAQTTPEAPPAVVVETQVVVVPPTVQAPQVVQPAVAIIAPTPTAGLPSAYTLQKSEFPYCIARRFNVDPGELLRMNGLTSYSVYYGGMVLRIPQSGRGFPGNRALRPHPATYTVRPGDTLFSIACIYGDVDPNMIAYVNGIAVNSKLSIGQSLNIP